MNNLIYKHKPILYLHSEEKYFPIDLNFIKDCPLMFNSTALYNEQTKNLAKLHSINSSPSILYSTVKFPTIDYRFYIDFNDDKIYGVNPKDWKNGYPSIYAVVKDIDGFTYVYYIILYAFNYGKTILNLQHTGDHYGDLECLIYQYKGQDLQKVYFSAHGSEDGRWVNSKDLSFNVNGNLLVYVALGGHANYPNTGVVFRYGGVANDKLDKGIEWNPNVQRVYLENEKDFSIDRDGWIYFGGLFGYDGIKTFLDKPWFELKPTELVTKPAPIISDIGFKFINIFYSILLLGILVIIYHFTYRYSENTQHKIYFKIFLFFVFLAVVIKFGIYKFA